ncbi:unnamed protein product [Auanema sp. JU1783]|nr:unnamed protein product [Auanema sp. JU1783]
MKLFTLCSRGVKRERCYVKFHVGEIHRRLAELSREEPERPSNYNVESMIGEKLLRQDSNFYKVEEKRADEGKLYESKETPKSKQVSYPLKGIQVETTNTQPIEEKEERSSSQFERGFFIDSGKYVDEYTAGNAEDIADDELVMSTRSVYGPTDAVEHIDFQLPHQNLNEKDELSAFADEPLDIADHFGTADPERAASEKPCSGCGSHIHCKDSSLPGFLPVEVFDKVITKKKMLDSLLCRRCYLLKHHNFLLNVNVCPVDYESMMSHLKLKDESLILLVVDVTDLPGSIHAHLPNIIGTRKPMIVIGNKVDLLPPDAQCGYFKNFRTIVQEAVEEAGFRDKFNILHTALVSAKTGYGVEDLITEIQLKYTTVKMGMRSDLYLVGCTNAGKSTLFNALLQSDLCKVRAVDLIERATTSLWPGTTISLLKFPVMKLSSYRMELRRRRLLKQKAWEQKEMYSRKLLLQETGDDKYAVPIGVIQNTYKEQEEDLQPVAIKEIAGEENARDASTKKISIDDPIFARSTWCYDTPGTVTDDQVTSLFTIDELIKVLPRKILLPRTCLLNKGTTLLIGGVGRVDLIETKKEQGVYLTVFASDELPLNIIETDKADEFLDKYSNTKTLVVPSGSVERMNDWPGLSSQTFSIQGVKEKGSKDVVLSSIGWVMVTTADPSVKLNVYTPGGKGISLRNPILPYSASLRGKRVPGSQFYKVNPIEFPVNTRRIKAQKNKKKFSKK